MGSVGGRSRVGASPNGSCVWAEPCWGRSFRRVGVCGRGEVVSPNGISEGEKPANRIQVWAGQSGGVTQ